MRLDHETHGHAQNAADSKAIHNETPRRHDTEANDDSSAISAPKEDLAIRNQESDKASRQNWRNIRPKVPNQEGRNCEAGSHQDCP